VDEVSVAELNELDRDGFVERVGFAFEDSPWIAAGAWDARPFESVDQMHAAMVGVVADADRERQVELIRAHPDLAGRAALAGELTPASSAEQASAGLDRLSPESHARLTTATEAYREKFGFPFVVCVREHTIDSLIEAAEARTGSDRDEEVRTALGEIAKIAALRLSDAVSEDGRVDTLPGVEYEISYGKARVPVYRHYATPLDGLVPVPESSFTGRANSVFANEISVEVFGDNFLPAYTRGDNSNVVATDSMKNFILREGRTYEGATLEGYLDHLGAGLLGKYEQMRGLRVSGRELPFSADTHVLHQRRHGDHSVAELRYERVDGGWRIASHSCGRLGLELLKTKGSAFVRFVRDEYTTLPERSDRPLFIHLDLRWRYADVGDALGPDHARYVAGEQVRDVVAAVFDEFVSESIQQLVHEMGRRLLERYPQLASLSFSARNLTRDPYSVPDDQDDDRRVFSDPFPAFGTIELTLARRG
jgi:urate oxidase / 2-oxo-4-hydroxy-4-carboxy-5-ureidoimidazoline decarboxylase